MSDNGVNLHTDLISLEEKLNEIDAQIVNFKKMVADEGIELTEVIDILERKKVLLLDGLDAWQKTLIARHKDRPKALDYINGIFDEFVELSGDRHVMDDLAIIGGMAYLEGRPVVVIGQEKGTTTELKIKRNFGMPHPEGYRKAMRIMRMAEKFKKPIITFVDTQGAYPGIAAEERGQALAIAENLKQMSRLAVPIVVVVIDEGGSGGALAIAVGDRILMLKYSIYSVITPEGCASILFKDAAKAPLAANALRITSDDLYRFGIIDEIIPEAPGGAHRDAASSIAGVKEAIIRNLDELMGLSAEDILVSRYQKFRKMGRFTTF